MARIFNKLTLFHVLFVITCTVLFHAVGQGKATFVSPIFDLYILSILIYSIIVTKRVQRLTLLKCLLVFTYFLVYAISYYFYNDYGYINHFEFFRSIRFAVYILILMLVVDIWHNSPTLNTNRVKRQDFESFFYVLLGLFLIAYLFQIIALGEDRPRLFSENNYEIPALLCFFSIIQFYKHSSNKVIAYLTYFCTLISLSKSGLLEAAFIYLKSKLSKLDPLKIFILLISTFITIYIIYSIFSIRAGGGDAYDMDRVKFLFVFYELVIDFQTYELLFGKGVASELPMTACIDLMYWANSISGDYAYCNATVFHSFLLKLFYEFGLVGSLLTLSLWYIYLKKAYGSKLAKSLFIIIFICSISVTGFSNSIVIFVVYLGILVQFDTKKINSNRQANLGSSYE